MTTTLPSSSNKYVLNYFNRHGKIELVRLIFAAANVEYEDNYIENMTDSDTSMGFMPYLQVNKDKLPLISVISRYLAKEFNISGNGHIEQAKCDAIAQSAMLLIDTYYRDVFNVEDFDQKKINLKDFLEKDCESTADTIENLISLYSKNENHSVGDKLTYADLYVYEMCAHYFPHDDRFQERFPKLFKIHQNVKEHSKVSDFIKKCSQQKSAVEQVREQ